MFDFPSSPTVGAESNGYSWDGEKWIVIPEPGGGGGTGTPSDVLPVMDGTAAAGVATAYSRGDHVHPSDTSRVPATRSVVSGAGLTGGGNLTADRTLVVGAGTGITVNADDVALTVPVTAANGGTGNTSYAIGDLLYASGATTLSKLADIPTGNALISGGFATAPSYGKIGLTTHVSGTLPIESGGTGTATGISTAAQAALDLKAPIANPAFTGTVTLPGAPFDDLHAATKLYVDSMIGGGGGAASSITFTPTGQIAAINVQSALAEVDNEKVAKSGGANAIMTGVLQLPLGTAPAAAVHFGTVGTGLYGVGAATVGIATSGVSRLTVDGAVVTAALPIRGADGAAGAPSHSFTNASNSGLYRSNTNQLSMSANGVEAMRWNADNSTQALTPLLVAGDPSTALQVAPRQYVDNRVLKSGDTMTGSLTISSPGVVTATKDGSSFGYASGATANKADANILLYDAGGANWCGIGTDSAGGWWLRTGLSGSPTWAMYVDPSQNVLLNHDPSASNHAANKNYVDGKVAKTGDTMTGDLTISATQPNLVLTKVAGANRVLITSTSGGVKRFEISMANSAAESGGNSGSNFAINSYDDGGTFLATPIQITRSSGAIAYSGAQTAPSFNIASATDFKLYLLSGSRYLQFDAAKGIFLSSTDGHVYHTMTSGNSFRVQSDSNLAMMAGVPYKAGGGSWLDSSDLRIKNVVGDYPRGLNEVAQLRPVHFTFKGNDTGEPPSHNNTTTGKSSDTKDTPTVPYPNSPHYKSATEEKPFAGLIAQEVEAVLPEMVTKRAGYIDGTAVTDLRDLDTTPLIFALINSIKELKARVETLEAAA